MGIIFGKITVETPKYEVIKTTNEYEIRKYPSCVIAEVTYDPSQMGNSNKDGGFLILANYIGALGNPQNIKPETIPMTAPVITKEEDSSAAESIAMTAPVVTKDETTVSDGGQAGENKTVVTMQFILPSKFTKVEEAPKPLDERVVIREEGERQYGVVKFSGRTTEQVVAQKAEKLKKSLQEDGYTVAGEHLLARYNDPRTLPMFRTNEVMFSVE